MGDETIRTARPGDGPRLHALEVGELGDRAFSRDFLYMAPTLHGPFTVVAETPSGDLAGYALGVFEAGTSGRAWVLSVLVATPARGMGLGARLTGACVAALEAAGAREVLLTVAPGNAPARRVYERLGFEVREHREEFFGPGEDRLLMARTTPAP